MKKKKSHKRKRGFLGSSERINWSIIRFMKSNLSRIKLLQFFLMVVELEFLILKIRWLNKNIKFLADIIKSLKIWVFIEISYKLLTAVAMCISLTERPNMSHLLIHSIFYIILWSTLVLKNWKQIKFWRFQRISWVFS